MDYINVPASRRVDPPEYVRAPTATSIRPVAMNPRPVIQVPSAGIVRRRPAGMSDLHSRATATITDHNTLVEDHAEVRQKYIHLKRALTRIYSSTLLAFAAARSINTGEFDPRIDITPEMAAISTLMNIDPASAADKTADLLESVVQSLIQSHRAMQDLPLVSTRVDMESNVDVDEVNYAEFANN